MGDTVRIIDIHEREVRPFPRSEIIDHQGRSLILPETRRLSAVEIRDVSDGVQLRATGLIGYLPLTPTITLNIRPKFPLENLWYMLDRADESFDRILPIVREYQRFDEQAPHQLIARAFCHYLAEAVTGGLVKGYPQTAALGFFKPKVDFGKTISRRLSRGDELNCVSNVFTFSGNLVANRILKSACLSFYALIPKNEKWAFEKAVLEDALSTLSSVPAEPISLGNMFAADTVHMRIRASYRGALFCYSVFAGLSNLGFSFEAEGNPIPSFLFCLDDVFESFVRNVTREAFRLKGISVLDGNKPRNHGMLFTDSRRFPTKPDLAFRHGKTVIGIGEVKYKPKLDESDRYQLISHTVSSGSKVGIWISPSATANDVGMEYVGAVPTGAKFWHYRMSISGSLKLAASEMTKAILELVEPEAQFAH